MGSCASALRLGSTSYIYPEDVLPNVQKLAGLVQDIEWIAFEVAHGLPGPEAIAEMARLGQAHRHSYTVHLPLDLALATQDGQTRRASLEAATRVIATAAPLQPWAYVVHLHGEGPGAVWGPWHERASDSLAALAEAAGGPQRLAVENVPEYPFEHLRPLLERVSVSLCLDVGHLLRQGHDPQPLLEAYLERARAIHLHGVAGGRDHRSLATMDQGQLLGLLRTLKRRCYGGVVTIECFGAQPFFESWGLVEGLWRWAQAEGSD